VDKLLNLQIRNVSRKISKDFTLEEILHLLTKYGIKPMGNLSNTPKERILASSLSNASKKSIGNFLNSTYQKELKDNKKEIELHSYFLGTKVQDFYKEGHYEESVRIVGLRVNNRVKKLADLNLDGAPLMRRVFSRNNPLLSVNSLVNQNDQDEQEGIMHIFEGFMLAFRNPPSHDDERKMSRKEADELIGLANYLMRRLDKFESN